MNGEAFAGLGSLTQVWLQGNVCVDENFNNQNRVGALPGYVARRCGFCEDNKPLDMQVCGITKQMNKLTDNSEELIKRDMMQVSMLGEIKAIANESVERLRVENTRQAATIAKLDRQLKDLVIENRHSTAVIARLEAKLFAAEVARAQEKSQMEMLTEINGKLDKIRNDSCAG